MTQSNTMLFQSNAEIPVSPARKRQEENIVHTDMPGRTAALSALLLLAPILQGCWLINMGDVLDHTWIVEAYASNETLESASTALGGIAERIRVLELERYTARLGTGARMNCRLTQSEFTLSAGR